MNRYLKLKPEGRVTALAGVTAVALMFCLFAATVVFMATGCQSGARFTRSLDIAYNWGAVSGSVKYSSGQVVQETGIKVTGGSRTVYTVSDGTFTIGNLEPGTYVLTAVWDGTHTENSGTVEVTVQGGLTTAQDIVFGSRGLLRGTVVTGSAETPVSGALVETGDQQVTTGSDGAFLFIVKSGTHSQTVTGAGYQDVSQSGIVVATGADVEQEITLTSTAATYKVSGTIAETDATGVSGATVEFISITDSSVAATVLTATDGTYIVTSMSGGDYLVTASKDGYVTSSTSVTIDAERSDLNLTLDLVTEAATDTATITGKVTSAADDAVVSDVYVKATPGSGTPSFYEAYTGSDGTYTFSVTYPRSYTVEVTGAGYRSPGSEAVTLSSATTEIVNFALTPLYRVSGTVKDATTSEGIGGATVELVRESDSGVEAAVLTTTDGAFTAQVPYGYYQLVAKHANYSQASVTVDVSADVTDQEVSMEYGQTGHTVSGLVYNVLSEGETDKETLSFAMLTLTLDGAEDFAYTAMSNENGTFTMEAVYPGQYDILAEKGGFKDTTVTRRVAGDVTGLEIPMALDVDPVNAAIAGTVIDETTLEPETAAITVELWGVSTEATEVLLVLRYGRFDVGANSGGRYYLLDIPISTDMVLGLYESGSGTDTVFVTGTTQEVNLSSADKTYLFDIINP